MKLAILSLDGHNNYGNRLQNYALNNYLSQYGSSQSLWWSGEYELFAKKNLSIKDEVKLLLNYKDFRKKIIYNNRIDSIREYRIKKFSDKYINTRIVNPNKLDLNGEYDYFIVGSDQVWNPLWWNKEIENLMFLNFTTPAKKIAYAASIGISKLPLKYELVFSKNLSNFEHISVREDSAADIIEKLTGRKVPVLLDPTLLIHAEQWESIERKPEWYQGNEYILTYFLGEVPENITKFANQNKYQLINLMSPDNLDLYSSSVEEFLYLIHHAKLFCTDSFHGCVFSIQFRTPFIVVDRQQNNTPDMFSRLETLLNRFRLTDQYCNFKSSFDFDNYIHPDFSYVEEVLKFERSRSNEFFSKIIY